MEKISSLNERNRTKLIESIRQIIREILSEQVKKYSDTLSAINEGRFRKIVIRGGKRKVKMKTNQRNQKIVGGKAVTMRASERIKRGRGAKKAARKRRGKQSRMNKKRLKSMKKRIRYNLGHQH
jgi:hypothetical protein